MKHFVVYNTLDKRDKSILQTFAHLPIILTFPNSVWILYIRILMFKKYDV